MTLKCVIFSSLSMPILVFFFLLFFFSSFPGLLCDAPQQICQCDYTDSLAPVIHHIHSMQVVLHYPVNDLHAPLTSQGTNGKIKRQHLLVEGHHPMIERQHPVIERQRPMVKGQQMTKGPDQNMTSKGSIIQGLNGNIRRQH